MQRARIHSKLKSDFGLWKQENENSSKTLFYFFDGDETQHEKRKQ